MRKRSSIVLAALQVIAALTFACGGPEPVAEPPKVPPTLPPSMKLGGPPVDAPATPKPPSPDVARGKAAVEQGNEPAARAAFEAALVKDPNDADAHGYLGALLEKNDKVAAEKHYRAAIAAQPGHEVGSLNLSALLLDLGKLDEAVEVCKAASDKHPQSGALKLNLGTALASKGDEAGSTAAFADAVKLAPKDPIARLTYGQWLGKWKKTEPAKEQFLQAEKLANGDIGILASVGFELKNVGAFADCVRVLDGTIAKKEAAELRTYRALCKLGAQDKAGAQADLEAAVAKEPKYGPAYFYLGGRYAEAGKWKEVVTAYETYLKLEPDGPLRKMAEERIKLAKEKQKGGAGPAKPPAPKKK